MAALIHIGLGEWRRVVDDLASLDLLKPGTDRRAQEHGQIKGNEARLNAPQPPQRGRAHDMHAASGRQRPLPPGPCCPASREELAADLELEFTAVVDAQRQKAPRRFTAEPARPVRELPLLSLQSSNLSFRTLTSVLFKVAYKYK